MNFRHIFGGTALLALSMLMFGTSVQAASPNNLSNNHRMHSPTDTVEVTFGGGPEPTVVAPRQAPAMMPVMQPVMAPVVQQQPPVQVTVTPPAPQKMKYVYMRPLLASQSVYCRPVPPAKKCDDGGIMGYVAGLFGARSTAMSAQPGFPRLATVVPNRSLANGYKPPVVAVPVN